MPGRSDPQVQRRSDAISIARVVCIIGIVYVHAWTGLDGNGLAAARGTPQEVLRWTLMEGFGRSAVPLLGLISGYLVASSHRSLEWRRHIARKARTILLPMVLWNALAIVLVSGTAWLFDLPAPTPHSLRWVIEELLVLTRNPDINVQMPFLRDLFLCMVIAPLLLRLPTWSLGCVAVAAALCQILGIGAPVILRASILMFFVLGILAKRNGLAEAVAAAPPLLAALPLALLLPVKVWVSVRFDGLPTGAGVAALDLAVRMVAAAAFWRLAWSLAGSSLRHALLRIESYVFFLFCSHLILIWLAGPLIGRITGPLGSPAYPAFFIAQPLLVLAAVIPLGSLLTRVAPGAARVLSGGRLRPPAASPPAGGIPAVPVPHG